MRYLGVLAIIGLLIFSACEKDPGVGGTSSIVGTIIVQETDNFGNVVTEYAGPEERVYIIYGDGDFYDDEVRTNYDGRYKFDFLTIGNYRIFAYTDCKLFDSCDAPIRPEFIDIQINSNDQVVNAPDLIIQN